MGSAQLVERAVGGHQPGPDRGQLAVVAARSRPVTSAADRLIQVAAPLAALLPDGGVRRGATVGVAGQTGAVSMAMVVAAGASAAGGWCAAVGLPDLGMVAAAGLGVALDRCALVPDPGSQWPVVVAALLESVEVVVVRPPGRVRPGDARRLAARARERGAVLVVLDPVGVRAGGWPEATDLRLAVAAADWDGLGDGHGHLVGRRVEVVVDGRRGAARARRGRLALPGPSGGVEVVAGPAEGTAGAAPVAAPGGVTARSSRAAAVLAAATAARDARRAG